MRCVRRAMAAAVGYSDAAYLLICVEILKYTEWSAGSFLDVDGGFLCFVQTNLKIPSPFLPFPNQPNKSYREGSESFCCHISSPKHSLNSKHQQMSFSGHNRHDLMS